MSVRIATYLNSSKKEIASRLHNIWIAVSLGNKFFTDENIEEFLRWALLYTKQHVLVLICDEIYSYNIEVLDGRNHAFSLRKALQLGSGKFENVRNIISRFSIQDQKRIKVIRWEDVSQNKIFRKRLNLVQDEYKKNQKFRDAIIEIILKGRPDREEKIKNLETEKLDRLAEYVLKEIPIFVDGVSYENVVYTAIPYPGLSKLDELFVDLHNGIVFPELAKKMEIENKIAILEAYTQ